MKSWKAEVNKHGRRITRLGALSLLASMILGFAAGSLQAAPPAESKVWRKSGSAPVKSFANDAAKTSAIGWLTSDPADYTQYSSSLKNEPIQFIEGIRATAVQIWEKADEGKGAEKVIEFAKAISGDNGFKKVEAKTFGEGEKGEALQKFYNEKVVDVLAKKLQEAKTKGEIIDADFVKDILDEAALALLDLTKTAPTDVTKRGRRDDLKEVLADLKKSIGDGFGGIKDGFADLKKLLPGATPGNLTPAINPPNPLSPPVNPIVPAVQPPLKTGEPDDRAMQAAAAQICDKIAALKRQNDDAVANLKDFANALSNSFANNPALAAAAAQKQDNGLNKQLAKALADQINDGKGKEAIPPPAPPALAAAKNNDGNQANRDLGQPLPQDQQPPGQPLAFAPPPPGLSSGIGNSIEVGGLPQINYASRPLRAAQDQNAVNENLKTLNIQGTAAMIGQLDPRAIAFTLGNQKAMIQQAKAESETQAAALKTSIDNLEKKVNKMTKEGAKNNPDLQPYIERQELLKEEIAKREKTIGQQKTTNLAMAAAQAQTDPTAQQNAQGANAALDGVLEADKAEFARVSRVINQTVRNTNAAVEAASERLDELGGEYAKLQSGSKQLAQKETEIDAALQQNTAVASAPKADPNQQGTINTRAPGGLGDRLTALPPVRSTGSRRLGNAGSTSLVGRGPLGRTGGGAAAAAQPNL